MATKVYFHGNLYVCMEPFLLRWAIILVAICLLEVNVCLIYVYSLKSHPDYNFFNSTEVNLSLGQLYFFLLNILLYMYIF
jgi:hypothetical protein